MARARFHPPAIALCGARKGSEADPLSLGSNRALSAAREPCLASIGPSPSMPSRKISLRLPIIVSKAARSEEHTSELQSLMRISYAVFCLKKKKITNNKHTAQPARETTHNHSQNNRR